jgi:hypothetical protein
MPKGCLATKGLAGRSLNDRTEIYRDTRAALA